MDLRQLSALVAVAERGTFSSAAAALHTVQSNVSAHVGRLERELGVTLFDRSAGRLTEEGEAVVARARHIQAELEALTADVAALRQEVVGNVRLGVISTTARWLVPLLLAAVAERHPKVRVVVVEASTTSLTPQLLASRLDLAVLNLPCPDPDLSVQPLFEEDMHVVAPPGHPLARRRQVRMADLEGVALFLPAPGTALRQELDAAAGRAGITLLPQAELDGVRLTASLVLEGHGAAILPATAIPNWQQGECRRVALKGIPRRQVGLAARRRGLRAPPVRALSEVLRRVIAEQGEDQPGVHVA